VGVSERVTHFESGAVIFKKAQEGFIANWSNINGIPRLFVMSFIGLSDGENIKEVEKLDQWIIELANLLAVDEGDKEPIIAGMFEDDEVALVTFEDWN